ncbi:hypothetical protein [Deinococcus sp. NW-56]|uniref:hypothetical protein n=1 Tax=Deinococcus sp. NW-56 TaxID=2080419 RepID=UPI000CF55C4C|nr:hypothetical protein [Deinococcus sp. NW-56]
MKPERTEFNDGQNWKRQADAEARTVARREAHKPRKVLPKRLTTLAPGDVVWYQPRDSARPHAHERATVRRAPRPDVRTPSVRLEFADGTLLTVPLSQVSRVEPRPDPAPLIDEARRLPSWRKLVAEVEEADHCAATSEPHACTLSQEAEQRARQLAGMVAPRHTPAAAKTDLARLLLEAARADVAAAALRAAGRAGHVPPPPRHLPVPTDELATLRLTQDQRAMVNRIALSLHRRYFLSDRELRALSEDDREQERVRGLIGTFIGRAQQDAGLAPVKDTGKGKGSELHAQAHDSLARAYPLALEACQALIAGKADHALTLALQVQELRLTHVAARRELDRARVKHHTGRYFHGDVLSVREEHVVLDEDGEFERYEGMTQYYVRLIVLYAPDGHSVLVANTAELESVTGTRVPPQAWASLCRWIEDLSERAGGRKQGRRHEDDGHLIYQDHDGHLELRPTLERYPDLLLAFEVLRRALTTTLQAQDITPPELGDAPEPGFHAPPDPAQKTGGLDNSSH